MSMVAKTLRLVARSTHQVSTSRGFLDSTAVKKWAFNASGFNQYGLYHDDAMYENDDVKEALKRVPQPILDERAFRLQRALHCNMLKTVLPKDQWPTFEEDRAKGRYLQPYLKEVTTERKEKEAWNQRA